MATLGYDVPSPRGAEVFLATQRLRSERAYWWDVSRTESEGTVPAAGRLSFDPSPLARDGLERLSLTHIFTNVPPRFTHGGAG